MIFTLLSDNPANVKDELLVKKIIKLNNIVIFEMEQNLYDHAQRPICLPEFLEFGDDLKSFRFSWLFYRTSYQGKETYDLIATVAKVLDPLTDTRCTDVK